MALRNTLVAPTLDRATQIAYQGDFARYALFVLFSGAVCDCVSVVVCPFCMDLRNTLDRAPQIAYQGTSD